MIKIEDWNALQETLYLLSIPGMKESNVLGDRYRTTYLLKDFIMEKEIKTNAMRILEKTTFKKGRQGSVGKINRNDSCKGYQTDYRVYSRRMLSYWNEKTV